MNISCPICKSQISSKHYTVISDGQTYTVELCKQCGHLYSKFDFKVDQAHLYSDEVYQLIDNRDSVYSKILSHEYSKVVRQISKYFKQGSRILDFGCGKGIFLNLAQQAGFRTLGIETSIPRADFAETKYGLKISRSMYTGGPIDNERFDVITLIHVLEHLPDPKQLLTDLLNDNLKKGGMLILEVPNFSSLQSSIAKSKWMHIDMPRHLSHFTRNKLEEVCSELELNIIRTEYFSWHVGVMGMSQTILGLFGYEGKIIRDLKLYQRGLMLAMLVTFPAVVILEVFASLFNRGGVIRVYCRRKE